MTKKKRDESLMKIFLSWSGEVSEKLALTFRGWLPKVFQSANVFMSNEDIVLGTRGLDAINSELSETNVGLLFITRENYKAPWVNFEAGALSKILNESHVTPLLFDIELGDMINSPISQFQGATEFNKTKIKKLVNDLNKTFFNLNDKILDETFEIWYPSLDTSINEIRTASKKNNNKEEQDDTNESEIKLENKIDSLAGMIRRQTIYSRQISDRLETLEVPRTWRDFSDENNRDSITFRLNKVNTVLMNTISESKSSRDIANLHHAVAIINDIINSTV